MTILYRCTMCDPELYQPVAIEALDSIEQSPFGSGLEYIEALIRYHHKRGHPECPASIDGPQVSVDFLLRMVQ